MVKNSEKCDGKLFLIWLVSCLVNLTGKLYILSSKLIKIKGEERNWVRVARYLFVIFIKSIVAGHQKTACSH